MNLTSLLPIEAEYAGLRFRSFNYNSGGYLYFRCWIEDVNCRRIKTWERNYSPSLGEVDDFCKEYLTEATP